MALLLLSAAAAVRSGGIAQRSSSARHGLMMITPRLLAPFATSSSPPPPPAPPAPPPSPRALEKLLRGAYDGDPAAATTAVLRGLPPLGRLQLLEALRREAEHDAQDLELGRRSALRFGQQQQQQQQQQRVESAAAGDAAAAAAGPPAAETTAEAAAAVATKTARAAAGAAAKSAVAAEAAAHRAEAAAAESADTVHALASGAEALGAHRPVPSPSPRQLAMVAASKGIPFLVFGMFDNGLMITGGGAVEEAIGGRFKLSVLCCAGLANTFADVVGLGLSHFVEDKYKRTRWARLGGLALTPEQAVLPSVRRAKWIGAAVGVATGCLIGLTPLLFMNQPVIGAAGAAAAAAAAAAEAVAEAAAGGAT